tara:strand:+ start:10718 stop:10906 length:189 start_codon:yes stop_codon:yes gene_type:complete
METKKAIELACSKRRLAKILGVSRQAVQQFGEFLPIRHSEALKKTLRPEWFINIIKNEDGNK